jgi:formamidopyrimidine-DNA glycosylase
MDSNKDYILNIRISRKTYNKIKDLAKENKDTISHVVRKVIDDSMDIASSIHDDIFGKSNPKEHITTYYRATAAQDIPCATCGKIIKKEKDLVVGETANGKKFYFCTDCM